MSEKLPPTSVYEEWTIRNNVFYNNSADGIAGWGIQLPSTMVESKPIQAVCAYCGMDDFAHNQCQRCGAVRTGAQA
jgi:hypothetical protein